MTRLTKNERNGIRVGAFVGAKVASALDAATFYLIFDRIAGVQVPWLALFVIAWCADTYFGPKIREKMIADAEAKKAAQLLGRKPRS